MSATISTTTGTTSVPTIIFGDNGVIVPSEASILAGVQADINAAFGGKLNPGLTTPQGQLASSEAAVIGDCNDQALAFFNNVDPAYSSGRWQDGIARIYYLTRNPAQSTVIQVLCGGLTGVIIGVGSMVRDPSGNLYSCTLAGEIPASGFITLPFAAVVAGPTAVPPVVNIYQIIPGWNTVAVASGAIGNVVESRADFEFRRANSVAQNAAGILPAIQGRVLSVANVLDAYVLDNPLGVDVTTGGVTLLPNSLYVCVAGGLGTDIANAIWTKKNPGCNYTGNTMVTVQDTASGYTPPYPSYPVTWQSAAFIGTAILVTLQNSPFVPSNALSLIQAAAAAAFTGADGGTRARIASTVFASRFYAGVATLGSWVSIVSIQIGTNAAPSASFTGSINGGVLTVTEVTSGALAVGQNLFGTGVLGGSVITGLGAGTTGGVGTYNLANLQVVASGPMTSVAPNQNYITMGIGQYPTLSALDVQMSLVAA